VRRKCHNTASGYHSLDRKGKIIALTPIIR